MTEPEPDDALDLTLVEESASLELPQQHLSEEGYVIRKEGAYEIYELNKEQKLIVDKHFKKPLAELIKMCYGVRLIEGRPADGRSVWGRSIKSYIISKGEVPSSVRMPQGTPELTADQKRFIENNGAAFKGKLNELAKLVWQNEDIRQLSVEWRAVFKYYKIRFPADVKMEDELEEDPEYRPPATLNFLVGTVNEYVTRGELGKKRYNWDNLKPSDRKCLVALMSYIRTWRFTFQASQYQRVVDRKLYVSTFMRFCHDKPDLTEIETDQFISAAAETVNIAQIERYVQKLDHYQQEVMDGEAVDSAGKVKRLNVADVELINAARTKWDSAKSRLAGMLKELELSRAKRIADKESRNSSILNLLEPWQTDEQFRDQLLSLGEAEKAEDATEVKKLRDLDDVTALIAGMTEWDASFG